MCTDKRENISLRVWCAANVLAALSTGVASEPLFMNYGLKPVGIIFRVWLYDCGPPLRL